MASRVKLNLAKLSEVQREVTKEEEEEEEEESVESKQSAEISVWKQKLEAHTE